MRLKVYWLIEKIKLNTCLNMKSKMKGYMI